MKRLSVFIFFALVALSGASEGATRLHFAAAIGDTRAIESLLAAGADVNAKAENGYTPLHAAALNGYGLAIHFLVSAGADVNARESDGYTPLHVVVMFDFFGGGVHGIEALVAAGANVAIRNNDGDTPLDLAYKNRSKAAVIAALEAAAR